MLRRRIGDLHEQVVKKHRRDSLRRLIEASLITAAVKITSPIPEIAVEKITDNKFRIATRDVIKKSDTSDIYEFSQRETVEISEPELLKNVSTSPQITSGTIEWDQPFVAVIPKGKLIGHSAVGYSESDGVILETTMAWRSLLERDLVKHPHSLAKLWKYESGHSGSTDTIQYSEICPLVNLYSNYYHWVQTSLPRLQGLRYYEKQTGREPSLLIRSDPPAWVREWLSLLGYSDERIIEWDRKFAIADRLIVPVYPRLEVTDPRREYSGSKHLLARPCACEWLRKEAARSVSNDSSFSSKVYISRDDAQSRRVLNEEELTRELAKHGFERYVLSELAVKDQVELFTNAETIVAPHGAGLVNMIFATDCDIIELSPPPLRPTFFMLSETLGLNHTYHPCESHGRHMYVNVAELREDLLEEADSR